MKIPDKKLITANSVFPASKVVSEEDKDLHVAKARYVTKFRTERTVRHKNIMSQLQTTAEEVTAEGEGLDPLNMQTVLRSSIKAIEDIEALGREIRKCIEVYKDMALRNLKEKDEWTEVVWELNKMAEEEWKPEEATIKEVRSEMKKLRNLRRTSDSVDTSRGAASIWFKKTLIQL